MASPESDPARYGGDRPHLLRFVDVVGRNVLDVGCGRGGLALHLKRRGAACVVGLEPNSLAAEYAREVCDEVIELPIEDFLSGGTGGSRAFDLIFFADTLEHMVDPWTVLERTVDGVLADGGQVFLSLPNVAHWRVVGQLVTRGGWRYEDDGVFDRTHLRWFGRPQLLELLDQAGLRPVVVGGLVEVRTSRFGIRRLVDDVSRWPSWSIFSFHVLAERSD